MNEHDPAVVSASSQDPSAPVSPFANLHYAQASAAALGLSIKPEWEAPVLANLGTLEAAALELLAFELPDDIESALIFSAS